MMNKAVFWKNHSFHRKAISNRNEKKQKTEIFINKPVY